ncbi:hypothetical protein ACHAW6_009200 [Cyclotella cf. meneghiniana]
MNSLGSNPPSQMIIPDGNPSVAGGPSAPQTFDMALTQVEIDALRKMREEISNMPHYKKSALVHVQRANSALANDRTLLDFLETERFDAKLASVRLARYWEARLKLFGTQHFLLPMTLAGTMRNSIDALKAGYLSLLPCTDKLGRPIIYSVNRKLTCEYHGLGQVRVWWYLIHLLIENPVARKRGFIVLSNAKDSSMNNFDTCSVKGICRSSDCMFPIRWKTCHVCHANPIFPIVSKFVRAFLSANQRDSFMIHDGSTEAVLNSLATFHLTRECLPNELGGTLNLSCNPLIKNWTIDEGGNVSVDYYIDYECCPSIDGSAHTKATLIKHTNLESSCAPSAQPTHKILPNDSAVSCLVDCPNKISRINQVEDIVLPSAAMISKISSITETTPLSHAIGTSRPCVGRHINKDCYEKSLHSILTNSDTNEKSCEEKSSNDASPSHPGRTGDPRMNRAVKAKLENPSMSLIAALVIGGFVFPDLEKLEGRLSSVKDTDNVTVYQRRNQLLRRLRIEKRKSGST